MAELKRIRPAPAAYKAEVCAHFGSHNTEGTKEIDKSHAVCKMCNAKIKYSGNTTNLRARLARHRSDVQLMEQRMVKVSWVDPSQLALEQVTTNINL